MNHRPTWQWKLIHPHQETTHGLTPGPRELPGGLGT